MSERLIRVGITHGDINGIGYEVILKTLDDTRILEMCTPVVYGSAKIAAFYRKTLGMQPVQLTQTADAADARDGAVNIINVVGEDCKVEPGQETATAGEAARAALERAVADLREGHIDVLVTAPINKHNVHSAEFAFPGHTEYLEASLGCDDGSRALMVLCSDDMRVALVTTHLPINQVPQAITREAVLEKLRVFNRSLVRDFGVHAPRIAVLSLNPHAGEGGLLGTEEQEAISPAIEDARGAKILAFGPYAADGFFGSGLYHRFDGVLAMYHDQGLAPFKALAMEAGVNFTAGLPYVRTSPDHGTGYDIAGKGEASEQSMRSAIFTAIDIYRNRLREDEATAHCAANTSIRATTTWCSTSADAHHKRRKRFSLELPAHSRAAGRRTLLHAAHTLRAGAHASGNAALSVGVGAASRPRPARTQRKFVPGIRPVACKPCGHRQYSRRGHRHCHGRPGSGVLDVGDGSAGFGQRICGIDARPAVQSAGRPLVPRRPGLLYQPRTRQPSVGGAFRHTHHDHVRSCLQRRAMQHDGHSP
jgi:4-hydroxythreonine-4-phosphate dehydrogenase